MTHQIRQQTQTPQIPHPRLSWFGLLFPSDNRDQTDVNESEVLMSNSELKLPHRFDERCRLDVADGTPELDDAYIGLLSSLVHGNLGDSLDPILDGVGEMRDDLNSFAEIVAFSLSIQEGIDQQLDSSAFSFLVTAITYLTLDDMLVDLSSSDVVVLRQCNIQVPFIVSQIQIGLTTIIENVYLTYQSNPFILGPPLHNQKIQFCVNPPHPQIHVISLPPGDSPCSVGAIVPASMFMYGSILIDVTLSPVVLRRRPVDEAVARKR